MPHACRTIVITGGIVSGIGKGITSASIGRLFCNYGYKVVPVKADPYLNQDAGTMNPFQHGEVFVTDDGAETDLDLGHYERFLDINLRQSSNFTSGSVYRAVMDLEREGEFLGKTIQIIPHVTDEIKRRLEKATEEWNPDFLIVELGGTVGDIEALPFIEAIRQYGHQRQSQTIYVHVVKMDYLYPSDEGKTKPIQHSVTTLRSYGIQPDILVVRCKRDLTDEEVEKIALFTGVPAHRIIPALDADSLYAIPDGMAAHGLPEAIFDAFAMENTRPYTDTWKEMRENMNARTHTVKIGMVGKYLENSDAYLSVLEAIRHAGIYHRVHTQIVPINSEGDAVNKMVKEVDAIIVPGGFGVRGIEGKIEGIKTAREEQIPFLGLCLGLQTAVIEVARHLAGYPQATSTEFEEDTVDPVVAILPSQKTVKKKGGTMRLGAYPAILKKDSLVYRMYKKYRPDEIETTEAGITVWERHRHRYEVNPEYHTSLQSAGLVFSGMSPEDNLVEYIEFPPEIHPYFMATQAHPEFRSRPNRPHPLFAGLIEAAIAHKGKGR
jgi:CTP synthase